MKKITFLLTAFFITLISWQNYAQLTEDFETDPPAGWTFMATEADDPGFVQTANQAHGGTYSFYHNDDNIAAISTAYMISPAYTVMTGDELNFWVYQNWSSSFYNYTGVWISTASNDPIANPADFTELQEFGSGFSEDTWTKMTYDLSPYIGQQVYVAFKYTGDYNSELYIDDFEIATPPTCPAPFGMADTNLTDTSVDLTWTAGSSETMWEIVYDMDPYTMPANGMVDASTEPNYTHVTPDAMASLTGLTPDTSYNLYYRAHCGGTDYSNWVAYTFTTPPSPPANDNCTGAIDLGNETSPLTGTTVGAAHDYDQDCLNSTAPDVVYSIMVPKGYTLSIGQTVNDYDSIFRVGYGGDCPGDTLIDCTDDPDTSIVTWLNDTCADQVVYWVQSGFSSQSGTFELEWSVTAPAVPANDECANPTALTVYAVGASAGNEVAGDTTSATESTQGQTSCDSTGTNLDVFYEFTVPAGETGVAVYFDGCVATKMELTVFDSCGGTEVAGTCQNNASTHLIEGLTGGATYLLQVWNDDFNAGSFTIAIESIPPPPANDNICDAEMLTVDAAPVTGNNFMSTGETNEPTGSCWFSPGNINTVWYKFVATSDDAIISTDFDTPLNDTHITLYSLTDCADATTLTEIACDEDGGDAGQFGFNSVITTSGGALTAGDTYYVQVDGVGSIMDEFQIEVRGIYCAMPSGMAADNITETAADLTWTAGGSETTWEVVYDVEPYAMPANGMADASGEPNYTQITTTPQLALSGLTSSTTYNVYYRSDCGGGSFSDWIAFTFSTITPPPANDDCANAITINCDDIIAGDTTYATPEVVGSFTGTNEDANSVWYTFVGTGDAVTLSTCTDDPDVIPGDGQYDTKIDVYSGDCATLTFVQGNDDGGSCSGFTSLVANMPTVNGTVYYVRVYGFSAFSKGTFNLSMTCAPACTPAVNNQDCASAIALTMNDPAVTSDNTCATVNTSNPGCDPFGVIADVWFTTVVPNSGELNVTTTLGTATDVNVAVYSGTCGSLTEIDCADTAATANSLTLTGLVAGDTYYIQAWNAGVGEEGTFDIEVSGTVIGVGSLQSVGFTYYPNPVKDNLVMKANDNITSVAIYNMLGQEVKSVRPSSIETTVDMSNLSSGTYFVKAQVGDAIGTFKVVKN